MIETKNAKSVKELAQGNAVSHPSHYAGDGTIECMDAMRSMMSGDQFGLPPIGAYWWACAFKYLWRWRRKGGVEDLQKCKQCIDYLLDEISGETGKQ